EAVVQPCQPARYLVPALELELVQLGAGHLLDREQVPASIRIDDRGLERRGAQTGSVQERAIDLDLPLRVVEEVRLRRARSLSQCPRGEVLEQQCPPADVDLDERRARAVLEGAAAERGRLDAEQLGELRIRRVVDRPRR